MHGWRQLDRSARDTDPARNVNDHGWGDRGDGQGGPGLSFGLRDREQVASSWCCAANPEDGALPADPDCAVDADGCRNRRPVSGDCEGTGRSSVSVACSRSHRALRATSPLEGGRSR
jgi:hypothetical protein